MDRSIAGSSVVEGVLLDWVQRQPEPDPWAPVWSLSAEQVAAELGRIQRDRARQTAREAELIVRLARPRPDTDDPPPGSPGARRSWRKTEPEFAGASEFFPDEVAHAINLGRGTADGRISAVLGFLDRVPAAV